MTQNPAEMFGLTAPTQANAVIVHGTAKHAAQAPGHDAVVSEFLQGVEVSESSWGDFEDSVIDFHGAGL